MTGKTKHFFKKHKFSILAVIIILAVAGYYAYGYFFPKKITTTYVTSPVIKGTITSSISSSGQVSASNTISLQFKSSGTITYLPIKNGQSVRAGDLIAKLDTTDAEKTVRNAQASLDSAQLTLKKLQGLDTLPVPQNKQDAINTLNQDYQAAYNAVSSVFTDLPGVMTDLQNIVYGTNFVSTQANLDYYTYTAYTYDQNSQQFKDNLVKSYAKATAEYTKNFNDYKVTTRNSDNPTIDSILKETYNTSMDIAQAIKDTNNLIQFYKNTLATQNIKENPISDTHLTTVNTDSAKINSDIATLLNDQNSIAKDAVAVGNADLDIQSQKLSVQNAKNNLQDAKDNLANYYLYAPFSGQLGKVSGQVGTQAGSGTAIATIITTQKVCTVPLNEVDVSKIQVGQKVVLSFDALPDLSLSGAVATIDPVGTTSSGVVTYNVQVAFDTQDTRVRSGMSINAKIITNVKQDVLTVSNGAIKKQGTEKYVQVLENNLPVRKIVTTGISNDTSTEILSGLNEGDKVITQTISSGTAANTASTTSRTGSSSARVPGLGGGILR